MSATVASGTQTAVIGTAHSLATLTALGVYEFVFDMAAAAVGDTVEITIFTRVLSGGALSVFKRQILNGGGTESVYQSVPLYSDIEYSVTLKQLTGTARAFPWKIAGL